MTVRPAPPQSSRDAGFSLLEALVTLFIVGLLSTAGATILSASLDGRERFDAHATRVAELERAHAALQADLLQLVRRVARDPSGATRPAVFVGGADFEGEPILAFSRTGREDPDGLEARGGVAYVEYLVADGALVRRMAVRADPTDDTPVVENVLVNGVERADVAFAWGASWREAYALAPESAVAGVGFPEAVALTLKLADAGEVRQLFLTGVAP